MQRLLGAPTVINLEITDVCNIKCRHCYNYWREDSVQGNSMSKEMLSRLIDMFVEAKVFHVVLTGGEPFANYKVLGFGFKKLIENNISISCNSNLMLCNDEKLKHLRDIGLDHILTSLNSFDPATNDYMANKKGAFDTIIKGIEAAVKNEIRISVNMIISSKNKDHVYQTGKFVHELGCQKLFGTRTVPPINKEIYHEQEMQLSKDDALHTLDQLVRIKEDTGIMIGTLVSYPLCLLSDLERYKDFVGRGCPAEAGHRMSIGAHGESHACVHEVKNYGNVFEIGLREAYFNMRDWHKKKYRFTGCEGCDYIEICHTGCRMSALGYHGKISSKDQLMVNKDNFVKPYKFISDPEIYKKIENGLKFTVPKRLRFRKEEGFYLLNIRWANTITCPSEEAEFLIKYRDSGKEFGIKEFGPHNKDILAQLLFKDAIECNKLKFDDLKRKAGLSIDIFSSN